MIDKTLILLTSFQDCSSRLSEHVRDLTPLASTIDRYFYMPLKKIFTRVIVFDYIERICTVGVKAVNRELIDLVRSECPEYVLWMPSHYEFRESTFTAISNMGVKIIGWFGDDWWRFDNYYKWFIPYIDYSIACDEKLIPKYNELNTKVVYALPTIGMPPEGDFSKKEYEYDVSFVGSRTENRAWYIKELNERNISVYVAGRNWGGDVHSVSTERMLAIFSSSKINLNFSWLEQAHSMVIRSRVWEVCLSGGFLLTEYLPGVENYFEIDKEIVCFKDTDELVAKINYYLEHDTERRAIAQAGYEKAMNKYNSLSYLTEIFRQIEEDAESGGNIVTQSAEKRKLSWRARTGFSGYYLRWGMGFLLDNNKILWKDAFSLAVYYNPLNILAWCGFVLGILPVRVRSMMIELFVKLYKLLWLKM